MREQRTVSVFKFFPADLVALRFIMHACTRARAVPIGRGKAQKGPGGGDLLSAGRNHQEQAQTGA